MNESYLGIDVHKRKCVFVEIDGTGKVLRRNRFDNSKEGVIGFLGSVGPNVHVVVEPTLNYLWLCDYLEPVVGSLHPANPLKVRVIAEAKCKTDKQDAWVLAELLRTNFLPESYYVPREIRGLREAIRQRDHLVKQRVMLKNRVRVLLFRHGYELRARDVGSKRAAAEIAAFDLAESVTAMIAQNQRLIGNLNAEIAILEKTIAENCHEVSEVKLLMSIPGIGRLRAATVYAEVVDIKRFRSAKAFASYCGLVPTVHQSGDHFRTGHISREGSALLRRTLVEAALTAHETPSLRGLYYRILFKQNRLKARVAIAHKLALVIYAMWTRQEPFHI
jgi:transposase